ncbi:MAG: DUF819 family protein, partial [Acidobacteriota bacterium]
MNPAESVPSALIQSPQGVLASLIGLAAFFFFVEKQTRWRLFEFLPPLIFIYASPVVLNNLGVVPSSSPVYGALKDFALPAFILLMLINVDLGAAVRIMGRGVGVMLIGTAGIVVGAPLAYALVHHYLDPDAWTGFGALAGSWIGGTGNMAAVAGALDTSPE